MPPAAAPAADGGGGPPHLAALLADQNLTGALKVLEAAIAGAEEDHASAVARLAQLHVNRGYCHQQLSLSRKALKARGGFGVRGGGVRRGKGAKGWAGRKRTEQVAGRGELEPKAPTLSTPQTGLRGGTGHSA
jgi:hypothetical protein